MADDRRPIAWLLSTAAKGLPPAERQQFREFLYGLDGGEPPRRKVHSWKRKKKRSAKAKAKLNAPRSVAKRKRRGDNQIALPFDD